MEKTKGIEVLEVTPASLKGWSFCLMPGIGLDLVEPAFANIQVLFGYFEFHGRP